MKILVSIISLFLSSHVFAATYECTGSHNEPIVEVSTDSGQANFKYIVNGRTILNFDLPDQSIVFGNYWETDRKYINFNPGWGESTVNIYGRISANGSLFDIYAKGMVGNVVVTLTNHTCLEI